MPHTLTAFTARAALVLALASPLAAQAGLVTGAWDPPFGPPMPDLSWSVKAQFTVPDSCMALGDGDHLLSSNPACVGSVVNQALLRLFSTSGDAPTDFDNFSAGGGDIEDFANVGDLLTISAVRVLNGLVVGVATNTNTSGGTGIGYPYSTANLGNNFGLGFSLTGPNVVCVACSPTGFQSGNPNVVAPLDDLEQVLTSYNDNSSAKLVDASGEAIGVRLDGQGRVLGLTGTPVAVPEPGSLALLAGALAAAVGQRRRRAG